MTTKAKVELHSGLPAPKLARTVQQQMKSGKRKVETTSARPQGLGLCGQVSNMNLHRVVPARYEGAKSVRGCSPSLSSSLDEIADRRQSSNRAMTHSL